MTRSSMTCVESKVSSMISGANWALLMEGRYLCKGHAYGRRSDAIVAARVRTNTIVWV